MLLDFNLAQDVRQGATAAQVGGTLPFMAPEQLDALAATCRCSTPPATSTRSA